MNFITKFINSIKTVKDNKNGVNFFGVLDRLTGQDWRKAKYLESYETSLYVYACVSKIAEKVAETELRLNKIKNSRGDSEEVFDHPALDLIYRPNPFQTKTEFWQTIVINLLLTGDAFAAKIRNSNGQVVELWALRPDLISVLGDSQNFIKEYIYARPEDGKNISIVPEDMIHWKKPTPLETYFGVSPVKPAAMRIDTEEFAVRFQRDFFLNSARPDAVLETTETVGIAEQKEIRRQWEKKFRGIGKGSKIAILTGGLKYQQISLSQKEMDYIESLKATRDDILVAFKTPKPIVAITDDVNRANAETAMYIFQSQTVKPEVSAIVESLNEMLIYPDFGDEYFLGYNDPTPENREATLLEYDNGLKNNWMLLNEVRKRENLPPVTNGWKYNIPAMVMEGGELPGQSESAKMLIRPEEKLKIFRGKPFLKARLEIKDDIISSLIKEKKVIIEKLKTKSKKKKGEIVLKKLIKKEFREQYAEMIEKAIVHRSLKLKKAMIQFSAKQKNRVLAGLNDNAKILKRKKVTVDIEEIFDIKKENKLLIELSVPYLSELAKEAGDDALDLIKPDEELETGRLAKIVKKRADMLAKSVNNTTLEKLSDTISEGIAAGEGVREIADRVQTVYTDFSDYRAELIARTETTAANNEGFIEAYKQSGVDYKEWIAVMDDRTRPEHADLDGTVIKIDEPFANGLQYPQEPNCRCVLAPVVAE